MTEVRKARAHPTMRMHQGVQLCMTGSPWSLPNDRAMAKQPVFLHCSGDHIISRRMLGRENNDMYSQQKLWQGRARPQYLQLDSRSITDTVSTGWRESMLHGTDMRTEMQTVTSRSHPRGVLSTAKDTGNPAQRTGSLQPKPWL